ncbi:protoporphyrinogen oxidase [uncultured Desulfovibrio sp.]|uniref:protoporphyrinogen oxidase n=1 Tax=uncultured Desulfovibrio sp. TaxID=167968 RepID=UPI002617B894|nr:protoporphyrinogen oxidase [uncultured Desulfovibrio sp.]
MARLLCLLLLLLCCATPAQAERHGFTQFSADLPEGWDGQERTAFSTGSQDEYMLVLGKQDQQQERFLAQISIYLLPNTPKATAEDFARKMTGLQGDASEPRQEGHFWMFSGVPRNQTVKGQAVTRVAATTEWILIIIAQDPNQIGADKIVDSLRGVTPEARAILGR